MGVPSCIKRCIDLGSESNDTGHNKAATCDDPFPIVLRHARPPPSARGEDILPDSRTVSSYVFLCPDIIMSVGHKVSVQHEDRSLLLPTARSASKLLLHPRAAWRLCINATSLALGYDHSHLEAWVRASHGLSYLMMTTPPPWLPPYTAIVLAPLHHLYKHLASYHTLVAYHLPNQAIPGRNGWFQLHIRFLNRMRPSPCHSIHRAMTAMLHFSGAVLALINPIKSPAASSNAQPPPFACHAIPGKTI